ncbi:MAG: hypothetical protein CMJ59_01785 [Planctomycetaceae bacterium]|nr:hypothetical protein [Planctomycetaceae bacterium]
MQTVQWNRRWWSERYHWSDAGDQWSEPWGDPERQWWGCLWPRICSFLPTEQILEIGPGFGRWTQFLLPQCERLTAVDLTERCVTACRRRFDGKRFACHQNDGRSLDMIPDSSIDLAFSFDSLVHVESDVIATYLHQLSAKLTPNGVGILHHSNLGAYRRQFWFRKVPLVRSLVKRHRGDSCQTHGRTFSVTAARFDQLADETGLKCISQELINWKSELLTDCISIFTPTGSAWSTANRLRQNPHFMAEAAAIRNAPAMVDCAVAAEPTMAAQGGWFRYPQAA